MFKKGDRVECTFKGEKVYGVVYSGGTKSIQVILDGGEIILKGNPILYKSSNKELPKDYPNIMDKWSIKNYKSFNMPDGYSFNCNICLNGKKVIEAMNHGNGGPNNYYADKDILEQFYSDVKEWANKFGSPYDFEHGDTWVAWYTEKRLYGVTAKSYFDKARKELDSYKL
jgi:hypothetical protein